MVGFGRRKDAVRTRRLETHQLSGAIEVDFRSTWNTNERQKNSQNGTCSKVRGFEIHRNPGSGIVDQSIRQFKENTVVYQQETIVKVSVSRNILPDGIYNQGKARIKLQFQCRVSGFVTADEYMPT
ncbi:hypothetical protein DPMN_113095 [Dreissena polymorpha]|uniref:Uncharacterized protein n=1 Tax=Dreissena polymorpha TaxID=45954 RepID=A0A9D4KGX4_DREPO|nr:hypothetical protein DPMN_113095 [Dreissena polymorpha]